MKYSIPITALLPLIPSIQAGEILLYGKNGCDSSYYDVFNTLASTGCQQLPLSIGSPDIESVASSSRQLGPACTFNLYTDAKCTKLSASLASTANPKKKCITREVEFRAYKVTCKKPAKVRRDEDEIELEEEDEDVDGDAMDSPMIELERRTETFPRISGGTSYYGPTVSYKNKPSGQKEVFANILIRSGVASPRPPGSASAAGLAIASTFFKLTPPNVQTFRPAVKSGGVKYIVQLDGYKEYNVQECLGKVGQAAFASLMADTVSLIQGQPQSWWIYDIVDSTDAGVKIGSVNVTYAVL